MVAQATEARIRQLVRLATIATILGFLHHVDHIVRGNHVGWPVIAAITPFTPSLLVYPVLIGGIYLTRRRRVQSRYWAIAGAAMLLLVLGVHFDPAPEGESIRDIYTPYADPAAYCGPAPPVDPPQARFLCGAPPRPWVGILAVVNMLALATSLALLTLTAVRGWLASRRTDMR